MIDWSGAWLLPVAVEFAHRIAIGAKTADARRGTWNVVAGARIWFYATAPVSAVFGGDVTWALRRRLVIDADEWRPYRDRRLTIACFGRVKMRVPPATLRDLRRLGVGVRSRRYMPTSVDRWLRDGASVV